MNLIRKSDYESYDYREFWQDGKRAYEDKSERLAVKKLLGDIRNNEKVFIDLGCGFGRLFNEYRNFDKIILVDYSYKNIKNAKELITKFLHNDLNKLQNIYFIIADINNLPFKPEIANIVLTVRVIHHLPKPEIFFKEVARIIKPEGIFILEFANKKNLKNMFKFLFGMISTSPFNFSPLKIGDTILNFHPSYIKSLLESNGFKILKKLSVSNFRLALLKKIIGLKALSFLENTFQNLLSFSEIGPSIFFKTKYLTLNNNPFYKNKTSILTKRTGSFSNIKEMFLCPFCKKDELKFLQTSKIRCNQCSKVFKVEDNIYDFRI